MTRKLFLIILAPLALVAIVLLAGRGAEPAPAEAARAAAPSVAPVSFPTTPPDASRITIGAPDAEGYATVTGVAGAVPANAAVVVINLNARTVMTATATGTGAFSAELYAPPGSDLLVKYETAGQLIDWFWDLAVSAVADSTVENLNPLPGTIIHAGMPGEAPPDAQAFDAVGAFVGADPKRWAGWWISGMIQGPPGSGLHVMPGDPIVLTAELLVTDPSLACANPLSVDINLHGLGLNYLFNEEGRVLPLGTWFGAHRFTPTGLPIETDGPGEFVGMTGIEPFAPLTCASATAFGGTIAISATVPADLPPGIYRPTGLILGYNPGADVPLAEVWFHSAEELVGLPPITVGDPAPPRIPWTLFGNELLNGHRGVSAAESAGEFALTTRVVLPPHQVVVPWRDERTGEPLAFHLEPGSLWLSATDRRLPNPPRLPLAFPSGTIVAEVERPDGLVDMLGPAPILQSSVRTPTTPGGVAFAEGTGHLSDLFELWAGDEALRYTFTQPGLHTIHLYGHVADIYGNAYPLDGTYLVTAARHLDIDPGQLPTTPYAVGNAFSPGLHLFPPVPADVEIVVTHLPFSDPAQEVQWVVAGAANRFGVFQPPAGTEIRFEEPGEFRVDITAVYQESDDSLWVGAMTWGNVVAGPSPMIRAHGRRGMDYKTNTIDDMPAWFTNANLPLDKVGIENYYPYFSGDVHWGNEDPIPIHAGDSIHTIITIEDLTGPSETIYDILRAHYPRAPNAFRWPPVDVSAAGLEKRLDIGEAPLFSTTASGLAPAVAPEDIDLHGYWYGSSQRPDVRVREIISEDNMGTAYWRFNDTYGYQIGEPADGDQPGDIKWEFGGVVLRAPGDGVTEYAIYSSLWVLLPPNDPVGARVTAPFQDALGVLDGGPILTLLGEEIDMLFLPKCVRPGDILAVGEAVAFCGHVGPPLDSRVSVTITDPDGGQRQGVWHANEIGWLYDPAFDFTADVPGRWTVAVAVLHDRPYAPTGVTPQTHNTGTVLGSGGVYSFYVIEPDRPSLAFLSPAPGWFDWSGSGPEPVVVEGIAPAGATAVHVTVHDKGIVMAQQTLAPDAGGRFRYVYDPAALNVDFSMLSLTAREGRWPGLADEVSIHFLATGGEPRAGSVTLIGEEVFVSAGAYQVVVPLVIK